MVSKRFSNNFFKADIGLVKTKITNLKIKKMETSKKIKHWTIALSTVLIFGCSSKQNAKESSGYMSEVSVTSKLEASPRDNNLNAKQDTTAAPNFISSSAARENKNDSSRKFIRTAEMKFSTKNVFASTVAIEDVVAFNKGFVTFSNLKSYVNYKTTLPISGDSSLETIHYVTENEMVLRVPNYLLDTTIRLIAKQIDFLEYRVIKAQDMSLDLLANSMKQKRLKKYGERMETAVATKPAKLQSISEAEEQLLEKESQSDDSKMQNLKLNDEISYSTVKLFIYEREKIKRELVENDKNITAYEPSFGARLLDSIQMGWSGLKAVFIFLMNIWPLFILIFAFIYFFRNKIIRKK